MYNLAVERRLLIAAVHINSSYVADFIMLRV